GRRRCRRRRGGRRAGRRNGLGRGSSSWRTNGKGKWDSAAALVLEGEKHVAQLAERAVGADFRRADGAFENAGDFVERKFLETAQQKHFAVVVVEAAERDVQEGVIVLLCGAFAGVRAIVGAMVEILRIGRGGRCGRFAKMVG